MDFVIGLPRTFRKNDVIWVVVDRLTKVAHFLPVQQSYSLDQLADVYVKEIVRLHGIPILIISPPSEYSRLISLKTDLGDFIFGGLQNHCRW